MFEGKKGSVTLVMNCIIIKMYHTITFSIHVRSRTILKSRLTSLSLNAYAHLGESTKHTNYFLVPKKWQNLSKSLPVIQVIMYRKVNRFLEVLFNLISSRATSRKICLNRPHNFQVNVNQESWILPKFNTV